MERVSIHTENYDPWALLQEYQNTALDQSVQFGATSVFVGTMRDFNEGDDVCGMVLEHYPGMTEKHLEDIIEDAKKQWDIMDAVIAHRVGDIKPTDPIVLTAVWSAHRKESIAACRFLIEELKHRAPFWKKETLKDGTTRWVESNTAG